MRGLSGEAPTRQRDVRLTRPATLTTAGLSASSAPSKPTLTLSTWYCPAPLPPVSPRRVRRPPVPTVILRYEPGARSMLAPGSTVMSCAPGVTDGDVGRARTSGSDTANGPPAAALASPRTTASLLNRRPTTAFGRRRARSPTASAITGHDAPLPTVRSADGSEAATLPLVTWTPLPSLTCECPMTAYVRTSGEG